MTMTPFQLEGLQLLGYTKRESEFLFLVATHSGYFTNRQFKLFAQTESGSVSHAFIRKLLERKHASFHAYRSGGRVYHLFARKVYQAIDRENLRTRKKHQLDYVKTRLVTLDFVIEHPQHQYLDTESNKVSFFVTEFGIARGQLPVKQYRARRSAEITPRYFVDRFPLYANSASATASITFTYVDAQAITLEAFGTHLRAYLALFRALPSFQFIFISPSSRLFTAAETEFHHVLKGRSKASEMKLLDYFRLRKAWDTKQRVASNDVVLMKEAQSYFSDRSFEDLYEQFLQGNIRDEEVHHHATQRKSLGNVVFQTILCGSSLQIFADRRTNESEICKEVDESTLEGQGSDAGFAEISESFEAN